MNSVVELTLNDRKAYGIIRWIGKLPERMEIMAGIELVKITPPKHVLCSCHEHLLLALERLIKV